MLCSKIYSHLCGLETIHLWAKIRNTNYTAIPQLQIQQFIRDVWWSCPRTQIFILPSSLSAENMSAFLAHQRAIMLASWQNIKQRQKPTYRSLEGLLKLNTKTLPFGFGVWRGRTVLKTVNRLLKHVPLWDADGNRKRTFPVPGQWCLPDFCTYHP